MVRVGNPGNAPDVTGYGAVDRDFSIATYETTVGDWVTFLNAVATDSSAPDYVLALWQREMNDARSKSATGPLIVRSQDPTSGTFSYTIAQVGNVARDPQLAMPDVNWFAAARYANWMNNGGTVGAGTETGAYTLNGAMTGLFLVNPDARYWIPSEDQWYKAAYYDPTKNGTGGYWKYATQSDTLPNDDPAAFLLPNTANYNNTRGTGNKLTPVGAYANAPSYYGTFDMTGNLWEWTDGIVLAPTGPPSARQPQPDSRIVRGGSWSQGIIAPESLTRRDYPTGYQDPPGTGYLFYTDDDTGFRLAGLAEFSPTSL